MMFVIVENKEEYEDVIKATGRSESVIVGFVGMIENEFYFAGERSTRPPRDMAHVMAYMNDLDKFQEQFQQLIGIQEPEKVTIDMTRARFII